MSNLSRASHAHALRNSACALAAEGASLLVVDAILDAADVLGEKLGNHPYELAGGYGPQGV